MERRISTDEFRRKIKKLPADEVRPGYIHKNQKGHWLHWLFWYNEKSAYGRAIGMNRDAKWAYNHIVCPDMLIYLIKAINIQPDLVMLAEKAFRENATEMHRSGEIRKIVPWPLVYDALWGNESSSLFKRFRTLVIRKNGSLRN